MTDYFSDQELIPYCYLFCYASCWGDPLQKSPRLCHFKSDRYQIYQDCSSTKSNHAPIDGVGFLTWCHTFKMGAMLAACSSIRWLPAGSMWCHGLAVWATVPDTYGSTFRLTASHPRLARISCNVGLCTKSIRHVSPYFPINGEDQLVAVLLATRQTILAL